MPAVLEVSGIVTRFGAQTVHNGLDMQVQQGEVFGVIGGSGAGKSVLLRTILGLRRPNAGTVRFLGRDLQQLEMRPDLHALESQLRGDLPEGASVHGAQCAGERAGTHARASAAFRAHAR